MRYTYVTMLLNYVFFDKYNINTLSDMTVEMIQNFLNDYGMKRLPGDSKDTCRSKKTVNLVVSYIIDFLEHLLKDNTNLFTFTFADLFKEVEIFAPKSHRGITTKYVPIFDVLCLEEYQKDIFRDMPISVFEIFLDQVISKHKRILMLFALCSFAGLRPSEACNVYREDSPICRGIRFTIIDGHIEEILIDITQERVMRSDLKSVGKIKRERIAKVFPAFNQVFMDCYSLYMDFMEGKKYESDYGPLTINRYGRAITYQSFYDEFAVVVKECIPRLLSSNNAEMINYGHLLLENNISPHVLRHWFSVQLTLMGVEFNVLQSYRGDKSPESSLIYLNNKSEIVKKYRHVANETYDYQIWKAKKMYGKEGNPF